MHTANRVSRNFVKNHGRSKYRAMLIALQNQENGQVIADMIGVSRERVRQYKDTFGDTTYTLHGQSLEVFHAHHRDHWEKGER